MLNHLCSDFRIFHLMIENSLKISVVTAVLNRADTIAQAMKSVQLQSYSNIEHIIQDGLSSDGTFNIISALANEKTKIDSRLDSGLYDAINSGIRRSTGDIVGLMHSDDFFAHPNVLNQVAIAFENPNIHGVYGDLDYVSSHNPDRVIRRWKSGYFHPKKIRWGWMPPHPTLYLRRNVFEHLGYYDTNYRISADYEAILRYISRGKINLAYIPDVMIKMRIGGESNRSLDMIIRKSREDLCAIRANKIGGFLVLAAKNIRKVRQFI